MTTATRATMGGEHAEQVALVQWAAWKQGACPALRLLHAIPNGGKRDPVTAARMKAEGVRAGVPDLCLSCPRGGFHALYIEMKVGRNRPSPEQQEWAALLRAEGYRVETCYGWQAAAQVIADYLGIETGL